MTSYFDGLAQQVAEASRAAGPDDQAFIVALGSIEAPVHRIVSLCCGDREFPDHFRERAMQLLATAGVGLTLGGLEPLGSAVREAAAARTSPMLDGLHSLFHRVASARVMTRFGLLSDDPLGNVRRRDAHDDVPA